MLHQLLFFNAEDWPESSTAASSPEKDERSALDELFEATVAYRKSGAYMELMQFIARFPKYSPFNCFLLHTQNPKVTYTATPSQWKKRFGRSVNPNARPMIILAPMTPVLFVYDLADTTGRRLPPDLETPFDTQGNLPPKVWGRTLENCGRDRIAPIEKPLSPLHAGTAIRLHPSNRHLAGDVAPDACYAIHVNTNLKLTDRYSSLVHELGHIFCGHLGSTSGLWWPDRRDLSKRQVEIEAESVAYLVCRRLGLKTTSAEYLAGYATDDFELPPISLDAILRATGYIELMGKRKLPARKKSDESARNLSS